jgi:DNA-binding NtrC family response regulator
VVFLTAHGTVDRAVAAVRAGAFDFLEKPPGRDRLLLVVANALRQSDLEQENRELRGEVEASFDMIGSSAPMRELFDRLRRVAPTEARVLVLGENGTGKELIARAIHRHSRRAAGPFVRVNSAAVPRDLFESELFGHEKGSFTGATARRRGKFVRAHGGTLFLDEVGEIPVALQAKLLRAIEAGEVEPVGAEREVRADVRVVAATNKDLARAVSAGEFREDLYYRLQVVTLTAPPLRERRDDIPELVQHFLRRACHENKTERELEPAALVRIVRHDFPGNVRELRNLIERLVILTPGPRIDAAAVESALPPPAPRAAGAVVLRGSLHETVEELERRLVTDALERHGWRMTAAARELGLERSHLYKKLKALGIERPDGSDMA